MYLLYLTQNTIVGFLSLIRNNFDTGMVTWTKEAVEILIDAYKNESCLYATKNSNYHNKIVRSEALKRICAIVCTIRLNTNEK